MTTYKLPIIKLVKTLFAFIVSWIGAMVTIACTTLFVKVVVLYIQFIWNLWL